jgi:hypothetical protein
MIAKFETTNVDDRVETMVSHHYDTPGRGSKWRWNATVILYATESDDRGTPLLRNMILYIW